MEFKSQKHGLPHNLEKVRWIKSRKVKWLRKYEIMFLTIDQLQTSTLILRFSQAVQVFTVNMRSVIVWYCVKYVQIRSYFWSIFCCFQTRKNTVLGHFSHSGMSRNFSLKTDTIKRGCRKEDLDPHGWMFVNCWWFWAEAVAFTLIPYKVTCKTNKL